MADITIGKTICKLIIHYQWKIEIEEPTLSMNFYVNAIPFAGKSGKYVTS